MLTIFSAAIAAEWMESLRSCIGTVLPPSTKGRPEHSAKPVRIAILDTGARLQKHVLTEVFDDRLIECRTWLASHADEGDLIDANSDEDGHGTHETSVLLGATAETDIEVCVAQVFRSRTRRVKNDRFLAERSVWAVQKVNNLLIIGRDSANSTRQSITLSTNGRSTSFRCLSASQKLPGKSRGPSCMRATSMSCCLPRLPIVVLTRQ